MLEAEGALSRVEKQPGTYVLTMAVQRNRTIQVGRLGPMALEQGTYLYVGSALGVGGLRARLARHLRQRKRLHWHIDYLLPVASPWHVFYAYGEQRLEHSWARQLCEQPEVLIPLMGFGASDCACPAHLICFPQSMVSGRIWRVLSLVTPESHRIDQLSLI